jgi:DNA processing protein
VASLTAPVRPPDRHLEALVRAAALPGVGSVRLRAALDDRAGAVPALGALVREEEAGLRPGERERSRGWAARALQTIRAGKLHVLVPGMPEYPPALLRTIPPPCPLFAQGRLELLDTPVVAVVGTRRATAYGREAAHRIAWGIAAAGATVISGLAAGIDGVAHRAAGPTRTIGVVGSGLDVAFPTAHAELQRRIGREGLLLSEQLPGAPPAGHNFPRRNRIIAALALGVVVVEAPARSGALSTARQALEAGAEIFAVPGPIGSDRSVGCNALIRDGATLVSSAAEVLGGLHLPLPPGEADAQAPPEGLEGQGLVLWRALGPEPRHVDDIAAAAGLDARRSLASLLALEVRGHARQLAGLRFSRS